MTKTILFGIDIQNDFMDQEGAALPVPGATNDSARTAYFLNRLNTGGLSFQGKPLGAPDEIINTYDTHELADAEHPDIAHPAMWRDRDGNMPEPFTMILSSDIENGTWQAYEPALNSYVLWYTRQLEKAGNFNHFIWPVHCESGKWGQDLHKDYKNAVERWERKTGLTATNVVKGTNPLTENYGAIHAEVQLPDHPETLVREALLDKLRDADLIFVAGQAQSHCVNTTIRQCAALIGKDHIGKFILLRDCMSPVAQAPGGPDFPAIGRQFLADMAELGMTVTTTKAIHEGRV